MTEYRNYAQFNTLTVTGGIHHAELVERNGNEWLSITVITTPETDGPALNSTVTNSNRLMGLFKKGWLPAGRQVTVTGHIASVSQVYEDEKGNMQMLKRPKLHLKGATILDGGLGPMPKDKMPSTAGQVINGAPVDSTPTYSEATNF